MPKTALLALLLASGAPGNLTLYHQGWALVEETVPLDLKQGVNTVERTGVGTQVQADSVVLRDKTGRLPFDMVEQTYRGDPLNEALALTQFEGKTLDFVRTNSTGAPEQIVQGKLLRSGYLPALPRRPGSPQYTPGQSYSQGHPLEARVTEVDGKVRFGLPGSPLFPALDLGSLEPRLEWKIRSEKAGRGDALLSYVTGGVEWTVFYSLIEPEKGGPSEVLGMVTIENGSGRAFPESRISLVSGDFLKASFHQTPNEQRQAASPPFPRVGPNEGPRVYGLPEPVELPLQGSKQVGLLRAERASVRTRYVYDGVKVENRFQAWSPEGMHQNSSFGTESTRNVAAMKEIANTAGNGLGKALPPGTVRYYRRQEQGGLVLLGEGEVGDVAPGEALTVPGGSAPDLTGDRKRVAYNQNYQGNVRSTDESFEITLKNAGKEPASVVVVEHLYRGQGKITVESDPHVERDPRTIEYEVTVPPQGQKTVTYTVRYPL